MVLGDSLTVEALNNGNLPSDSHVHARGGTAPCDWQPSFRSLFDGDARPAVVVFAFVGNTGTPCMAGTTSSAVLGARYRSALADMAGYAIRLGSRVRFLVPPAMSPDRPSLFWAAGDPAIGQAECALASTAPQQSACSTAAYDALTPGGVYNPAVRATDGVHLNAEGDRLYGGAILVAAN